MINFLTCNLSTLLLALLATGARGAVPGTKVTDNDWPWWRGVHHNGITAGTGYPVKWS